MMKKISKRLILLLQIMVVFTMFGFILFYNFTRARVIVLHSYSSQVPEVMLFNKGFSKIADDLSNPYLVYTYMNMALACSEKGRMRLGSKIRSFIQDFKPDILVAVGEEAQEYAARHYVRDKKTTVVFAGIRRTEPYEYTHAHGLRGVLNKLPVHAIKEVLRKNYQNVLEEGKPVSLYFIGDRSFRVTMERDYMFDQPWTPFKIGKFFQLETFDDWCQEVEMLKKRAGVGILFLLGYHHLKMKRGCTEMVPWKTVLNWTLTHSPYPVVGLYEEHAREGLPLTISGSSKELGEKAASLVQDLIHNERSNNGTFLETKRFTVGINDAKDAQRLTLPESFEVIAETKED